VNTTQQTPSLTKREREVLALIAEYLSDQEIADRLFVDVRTAQFHVANIRQKLGVNNRYKALREAERLGLLGDSKGKGLTHAG
jgi:LuxR family transcriptional regulator, maltose regulon positive regulatory protein